MTLRILFIGGNGTISGASSELAVQRGYDLTLLNRGRSSQRAPIAGTRHLTGDAGDAASIAAAIGDETFDVVANFRVVLTRAGRTRHRAVRGPHSASTSTSRRPRPTRSPSRDLPITESTPLRNPFWQYSRDKIAGEDAARRGLPRARVPDDDRAPLAHLRPDRGPAARGLDGDRPHAAGKAGRRAGRRHEPVDDDAHPRLRGGVRGPARQRRARSARRSTSPPTRCSPGIRSPRRSPLPPVREFRVGAHRERRDRAGTARRWGRACSATRRTR